MKLGKHCKSELFICLFVFESWFISTPLSEGESHEIE